jgi:tetratricopeptide (TPR) repeat protein
VERRHAVRAIPFVSAIVGALAVVPLHGLLGAVFGLFGGFFAGACAVAAYRVVASLGASRREAAMHADAMRQLSALGALGPMRIAAPPSRRTPRDLGATLERVEVLAAADLPAAILEAELLRDEYPRSAALLSALGTLYLASGRTAEAATAAREAIVQALATGATPVAARVFEDFRDHRTSLALDAGVLLALGRSFGHRGRFADAAECIERAADAGLGGERVSAELVTLAERAIDAKEPAVALDLLRRVLDRRPNARVVDDVRRRIGELESRV